MARRSLGAGGRFVFLLLGLALLGIALFFWLDYVVKPVRALAQGTQTQVTVTHCGATQGVTSCSARWGGPTPGKGEFNGRAPVGSQVVARIYEGAAYPMRNEDWTQRGVLALVGLGFAVVAKYLLGAAFRGGSG